VSIDEALDTSRRPGGEPLLVASGLTKAFAGTVALRGATLEVSAGEVHALLGENGSGKSTLIKILSGYHVPDEGTVHVDGAELEFGNAMSAYALGCRFIHQDLGLVDTMSVRDNLMLSSGFPSRLWTVRERAAEREAREMLERAGVELDPRQLVATLSPAQRTGVAVARALRRDTSVSTKLLVLDEPTATLPEAEVSHLLQIVRAVADRGIGIVYVTHRLDEVLQVAERLTVLRDGSRVATRPSHGIARAKLVEMLVGSDFEEPTRQPIAELRGAEQALAVQGLSAGPVGDVSFVARKGEVLGVAGITGSGRETVLGTLFGAEPRLDGTVTVAGRQVKKDDPGAAVESGMAYLPADRKRKGGLMMLTARENVSLPRLRPFWKAPFLRRNREYAECRRWFEELDIRPATQFDQTLERFSGGNQQKVLLAKWLRLEPDVLLLDEPTQGVDVASKAEIHQQLAATARRGAAVVIASSDVDELAAVCTRVVVLRDGAVVTELIGDAVRTEAISHAVHGSELAGAV